jgi:hypothetical protein
MPVSRRSSTRSAVSLRAALDASSSDCRSDSPRIIAAAMTYDSNTGSSGISGTRMAGPPRSASRVRYSLKAARTPGTSGSAAGSPI